MTLLKTRWDLWISTVCLIVSLWYCTLPSVVHVSTLILFVPLSLGLVTALTSVANKTTKKYGLVLLIFYLYPIVDTSLQVWLRY
jgi:hypothetical protein